MATVSGLEIARGNSVEICKMLDTREGLSAEQYQICLSQGGPQLLWAVLQAETEHLSPVCQYWMSDERWNCSNISMPVFPKRFQSSKNWVHKRESRSACVLVQAIASTVCVVNGPAIAHYISLSQ